MRGKSGVIAETHTTPSVRPDLDQPFGEAGCARPVPKKPKKITRLIIAIVVVCCLCSVLCLLLGGYSYGQAMLEKAPIKVVVDDFMKAMEA
ncbi:MAG TPA: hypothetical protein VLM83_00790, partial [Anaerolineales bacterium]|nr:hypothetical protein [Anaerolineales bacterium]